MIEESICLLYHEYAKHFPEYADFWLHLAGEEERHAEIVTSLLRDFEQGTLMIQAAHYNPAEYHDLLESITKAVRTAQTIPITIRHALRFALHLEGTYAEQHLEEIFATVAPGLLDTLTQLHEDTLRHRQTIADLYESLPYVQRAASAPVR